MIQDIYIGVDGGATKCKVRIEDDGGNLLGQAIGGPANIRLSVAQSWQSIFTTITEVLQPHAISLHDQRYRFHVGLGLAGCEVEEARAAFLATAHPFSTLHLISDAHIACLGAHDGEPGAIIIVGTGVIGYQIENQKGTRVGGWGFPHDDTGGGAWLGLEAARQTLQWLDHRSEKSALVHDIFTYFDNNLNHFVSWANRATSNDFAKLAPFVINHSQQGETHAIKLMKKAAQAIDRISHALEKIQVDTKLPLPCALFGGIAPFVEPYLADALRARLVVRHGDANTGAILIAKQREKIV